MAFRGYQAGAVDDITKPFAPWALRSKVAVLVDLYLLHAELAQRVAEREALGRSGDQASDLLDAAEPADAPTSTLVERRRGALGALRHERLRQPCTPRWREACWRGPRRTDGGRGPDTRSRH